MRSQHRYVLNQTGALVYDPAIGETIFVQEQIPTYPFVEANANLFNFDKTTMAELKELHETCGYQDYIQRYLKFPPTENQPHLYYDYFDYDNATCGIFGKVSAKAPRINPCFDIYAIVSWNLPFGSCH